MKRFINPVPQYFLNNGDINSGGFLYFYENGSTTTLKNTYNSDGGSANTNPVKLDGEGRAPSIFGDGLYTVKMTDYDGVQQWVRHNVEFSGSEGQFSTWSAVVSYNLNDIVRYSDGFYYKSDTTSNLGNNPSTSTTNWSRVAFIETFNPSKSGGYDTGAIVDYNGYLYRSNADDNTDTPPDTTWDNLTFNDSIAGDFDVSGTLTAGSLVTDGFVKTYAVRKTTSQGVTSSTTLVDVTDMAITLENGSRYHIRAHISWNGGATTENGIKVTFTGGTVWTFLWIANANSTSANQDPTANSGGGTLQFSKMPNSAAAADEVIIFDAVVSGTGNQFKLQFAQSTSSATTTTLKSNSCMIATKLG